MLLSWTWATAQHVDSISAQEHMCDSVLVHEHDTSPSVCAAVPVLDGDVSRPDTVNVVSDEMLEKLLNMDFSVKEHDVADAVCRSNSRYGCYTPAREFSVTALPMVAVGLVAKADNNNRRRAAVDFEPQSHKRLDDYVQYVPLAAVWGMKALGVEGRSNWPRFVVSNAFSVALMAGIASGVKHAAGELRPDGTDRSSFPSGHTATAFMAATIMHKEYGMTRSPWYSVGAYALATTTGLLRALNNRHWISDIMVGAGIGIISTDLGYLFADLIFKDKGIMRTPAEGVCDMRQHPSFFSASLGTTKPFGSLSVDGKVMEEVYSLLPHTDGISKDNLLLPRLKLGSAATVNAEGAYFINPYVGFGGRLEVASMPVVADNLNVYRVDVFSPDGSQLISSPYSSPGAYTPGNMNAYFNTGNVHRYSMYPGHEFMQAVDNLPLFSAQMGVYGSLPVSRRCALGAKVLVGQRIAGSCNIDSHKGILPTELINGKNNAAEFVSLNPDDKELMEAYGTVTSSAYEFIDLDVKNSFVLTTGLSFSVMLRRNMGCKVYVDYSNSKFDYDLTYGRVDNAYKYSALYEGTSYDHKAVTSASAACKRKLNTIGGGIALQMHF